MRTLSAVPTTLSCVQNLPLNRGHFSIQDSQLGSNCVHYREVPLYSDVIVCYIHKYGHATFCKELYDWVAMGVNFKEIDNEQTRSTETHARGVTMRCDKEVWQRGVARCGKEV